MESFGDPPLSWELSHSAQRSDSLERNAKTLLPVNLSQDDL